MGQDSYSSWLNWFVTSYDGLHPTLTDLNILKRVSMISIPWRGMCAAWRTLQVDAMMDQDDNFNGYSVRSPGVNGWSNFGSFHPMRFMPKWEPSGERFVDFFWKENMKMAWTYDPSLDFSGNNAFGRVSEWYRISSNSPKQNSLAEAALKFLTLCEWLKTLKNWDCYFLEFHNSEI